MSLSRIFHPAICLAKSTVFVIAVSACSPQVSEQELVSRAQAALDQGNVRAAVIDVKTALQQNPDSPSARRLLAETYVFQQDPVSALDEFERSLRGADDPEVRVLYARALIAAGKAGDLLKKHAAGDFAAVGGHPQYLAALALAQAAEEDIRVAEDTLARALADAPGDAYIETNHALYMLFYTDGLEDALVALQDIVEAHPDYAEAWSLLGDVQQLKREFAQAETSYTEATKLNPFRLGDRLNLVTMRIEQGKMDEAKAELEALQTIIPDHPGVSFARGRVLLDAGDSGGALNEFTKVLGMLPTHKGSLYLAASANIREGNLATARSQLNSFLAAQPKHVNARLQLSSVLLRMGEAERAERLARDVLEEHEMNYPAMGLLAAALSAQGRHAESADVYQQVVAVRPESILARVSFGTELLRAGDRERGIGELTAARDLDPEGADVQEQLVQAYLTAGDSGQAKAEANAYLASDQSSPRPHLLLGRIALQDNDLETARKHFERALALDPGNVTANRGLAVLASGREDLDQARERYLDALEHHPGDTGTLVNLALVEGQRGDPGAMRSALEAAVDADDKALQPRLVLARLLLEEGRSGEAVSLLNAVRDDYPGEPGLWLLLTESLLANGALPAAEEAAKHLLGLLPEDAGALTLMARVELRGQRYEEAEKHLRQALESYPNSPDLHKLMADALLGLGNLEEASEVLEGLPAEVAMEPEVRVAKGRIALAQKKPADAESYLRGVMGEQPAAMTLLWLSGAVAAQGRSDEALQLLTDWLADNPEDVLVQNQLASSYLQLGREKEAREQYLKVLEKAPDNVVLLNNVSWLHRKDNPQQALRHIEKADRLAPNSPQVKDTYAMIQLELGATGEALALNQKALDLTPDNPEILYHRAMILEAAGQANDAIPILEKLVDEPDFSQADEARALLEQLRGS